MPLPQLTFQETLEVWWLYSYSDIGCFPKHITIESTLALIHKTYHRNYLKMMFNNRVNMEKNNTINSKSIDSYVHLYTIYNVECLLSKVYLIVQDILDILIKFVSST